MAWARHRTEWNQFAVGLPPAGVLGCPYPYRLVFACSTCSGVPAFSKLLIYKGLIVFASWNTDSVPACSKVFQVFRFRGAQRIGEQAANPRQPWATACLAVRVLAGGRHDAQHWRQALSSGASCSACWPGAGVQAGQSACGRDSGGASTGRAGICSRSAQAAPGRQERAGAGLLVPLPRAGAPGAGRHRVAGRQRVARAATGNRCRAAGTRSGLGAHQLAGLAPAAGTPTTTPGPQAKGGALLC